MRGKAVTGIVTISLLAVASALWLVSIRNGAGLPTGAIELRILQISEANDTTVWVTNQTDRTILVEFVAVKVRDEEAWIDLSAPLPLRDESLILHPHSASTKTIRIGVALPPEGWKLQAVVADELVGTARVMAASRHFLREVKDRISNGSGKTLRNPFSSNNTFWGRHRLFESLEYSSP